MRRVYIAGPMTGLPDLNYPAFDAAAEKLRAAGYEVQNPADNRHNPPPCGTWQGWMRISVRQVTRCDEIVMLPGWQQSKGACVEWQVAQHLGIPTRTLDEVLSA